MISSRETPKMTDSTIRLSMVGIAAHYNKKPPIHVLHKISGLFIYLYPVFILSSNTGTHYLYVDAYDQSSDNTSALLIVHYKDNCYVLLRSSSLILSGNIPSFLYGTITQINFHVIIPVI